jgi:micrococcal nuclease
MRKWLLLVLLGCAVNAAYAEEFTGKVIAVLDGDTVMVTRDGAPPVKIRLAEIDAPEVGHTGMGDAQNAQAGGVESKQSLSELVLNRQVSVNAQTVDQYGRLVAHLTADGKSVNEEQVRRGMAWEYSNYHSNKTYIALQSDAQQARRGLWSQDSPMPPWQWRKLHPTDMPLPAQPRPSTTPAPSTGNYTCGSKRHCAQMNSCDEARYYLTRCGVKSLDHDGDGVPCEKLCGGKK